MIVSEEALRKIVRELQDIQKKITTNQQAITIFLDEVRSSGWDDSKYIELRKQTDEIKKDLKPIHDAMKKFEALKEREGIIVKRMGELKPPKRR